MEKFVKIIKKIKIRNIIILILILSFNTYAWFLYATTVSSSLSVHVSSWNVEFSIDDNESTTNLLIQLDKVYPGMEIFEKVITVKNKGEIKAELDYEINKMNILDETFEVGRNITMDDLINKLKYEYPFKIEIEKDDTLLKEGIGDGTFKVSVRWAFESGDDEKDTEWGMKIYDFYQRYPDRKSIEIEIKLAAKQLNLTNQTN